MMTLETYVWTLTLVHVVLSLIGIAAGFVVWYGMFGSRRLPEWTAVFLATTMLTSATGYLFPVDRVLPSHIIGAISLMVLGGAAAALFKYRLRGRWRWIYATCSIAALYLNVFVGVVQTFRRVPFLHALAPTESEPPLLIAQAVVLAIFIAFGTVSTRLYRPVDAAPLTGIT